LLRDIWWWLTQYCSCEQVEKNEWAGHDINTGERGDIYRVLVGKPEGKRQIGRSRRRWDERAWTG